MSRTRYNFVTFHPVDTSDGSDFEIFLKLDSEWVRRAGLKPDVNSAVVSYKEFEKLRDGGDDPAPPAPPGCDGGDEDDGGDGTEEPAPNAPNYLLNGHVRFWFDNLPGEGDPNVSLDDQEIIDVEITAFGTVPIDNPDDPEGPQIEQTRPIEYRLWFADYRRKWQYPRGGRLFDGEINQDPAKDSGESPVRYFTTVLINKCLDAMGDKHSAPDTVDLSIPITNLQWFGAHPAEELSKILDFAGYVYCPTLDGIDVIQKLGDGAEPEIPAGFECPALEIAKLGRRGKKVVITSAPTPILDYYNRHASNAPNWQFVARNEKHEFQGITNLSELGSKTAAEAIRTKFAGFTDEAKERLGKTLYRYLKLDSDKYPPGRCPVQLVLTRARAAQGSPAQPTTSNMYVLAQSWVKRDDGTFGNSSGAIPNYVEWKDSHNVVYFSKRLGTVDVEGATDLDSNFVAPTLDGFEFAVEGWDSQRGVKEYFNVGFTKDQDGITEIEDEAAKAIVMEGAGGDDAIIVKMPELRMVRTNGVNNIDLLFNLKLYARLRAEQILRGSEQPFKIRTAIGFVAGDINGKVSEIRYNQNACTTTFRINSWFTPTTAMREDELERLRSGHFPDQHSTHSARSFVGGSGEVQSSSQILPSDPQTSSGGGGTGDAKLFRLRVNGGGYGDKTTAPTLSYDLFNFDDDPLAATAVATGVGLAGHGQRIVDAEIIASATYGIGRKKSDGTYQLIWCDEVYKQSNCGSV